MKKNSLTQNKGLSLSQAQSISNLCNQRASEISAVLAGVNNYKKEVDVVINGNVKTHTIVVGKKLPENVVNLIKEKASLHACQAFLMENIKAKDALLNNLKRATADISGVVIPERPKTISPLINQLSEVGEEYGESLLSVSDVNEFIEVEAYASHIGQFIHEGKPLDKLRKELGSGIAPIEWMTIQEGVKSPITVTTHHTSQQLLEVHEELAKLHREYEQRVNYFKAMVKNLTTARNADIAKHNADMQNDCAKQNNEAQAEYETAYKLAGEQIRSIQAEFEKERQSLIKEVAGMRIAVFEKFQPVINLFLKQIEDTPKE